jgi:hypothetical protein
MERRYRMLPWWHIGPLPNTPQRNVFARAGRIALAQIRATGY